MIVKFKYKDFLLFVLLLLILSFNFSYWKKNGAITHANVNNSRISFTQNPQNNTSKVNQG